MTNAIDPSLYLSNYQQPKKNTGSNILGKDDFLKLLMTQLQNQDPSSPMQDKDFIAQMAQFTTLEQMTNLNTTMDKLYSGQQQNQLISFNQFVGKEIKWDRLKELEDGTTKVEQGTGKIVNIQFKDNSAVFTLEDGTVLEPGNISQINDTPTQSNIVEASHMIGKKVTFLNDQNNEISAVIKSVSSKNGKITFQIEGDPTTTLNPSQIIKVE